MKIFSFSLEEKFPLKYDTDMDFLCLYTRRLTSLPDAPTLINWTTKGEGKVKALEVSRVITLFYY